MTDTMKQVSSNDYLKICNHSVNHNQMLQLIRGFITNFSGTATAFEISGQLAQISEDDTAAVRSIFEQIEFLY